MLKDCPSPGAGIWETSLSIRIWSCLHLNCKGKLYTHACSENRGTMSGLNLGELVVKTADLEPRGL